MPPSWIDDASADQLAEAASMALIVYTRLEEIVRSRSHAADVIAAVEVGDTDRARRALGSALAVQPELTRLSESLGGLRRRPPG